MAVKALKTHHKDRKPGAKKPQAQTAAELAFEEMLEQVENDPNATLIAKGMVPFLRKRLQSGAPYLTIEQIQAELGRD